MENLIVISGNSIEDLENGLNALKRALAITDSNLMCGGSSLQEVERGLAAIDLLSLLE